MIKLKTPRIPLPSSGLKVPIDKYGNQPLKNLEPADLPIYPETKDPLFHAGTKSDPDGSGVDSSQPQRPPTMSESGYKDPKLATFDRNVEAMRNNLEAAKANGYSSVSTKARSTPVFLKPAEKERLKKLLLLADGGEAGASSGDYRYNPKTGKIEVLPEEKTELWGAPKESSDVVDIISDMPTDFNFDGWDDKSGRQQQNELQKAGLNPTEQLTLLNSGTSLETLAIINDISKNRSDYGLSVQDVKQISEELLQISNARVGAKNNALPLGANQITKNIFLNLLNEKEQALLASFGYGIKGIHDLKSTYSGITDQITDLLEGDNSISANLHGDSDLFEVADQYFGDMAKLDQLITDIEDNKVRFRTPADQQRYLDYLTSEYNKNNQLYRQQLASEIDDARLLEYPRTQFKQLINDLSLSQLEVLVAQIDENGVKKLSRPNNFDKLMKELLSDQSVALSLLADETKSPIRPRVWNGMDIVNETGIQISGYYYEDGVYKGKISCPDQETFYFEIGKKLPEEVAISVTYADWWDIQSDIA